LRICMRNIVAPVFRQTGVQYFEKFCGAFPGG
jgi:hypothetical protein